jgi:hypothetical protein
VVEGLLKMSADNADGMTMTFTGVPPAAGLARHGIKREPYRYNVQAMRKAWWRPAHGHLPLAAGPLHWLQPLCDEPAQRAPGPVHRGARSTA